MTTKTDTILDRIAEKAEEIRRAKEHVNDLISQCDDLVLTAIDEDFQYKDIAAAADRAVAWVQTSLYRKGVDGKRGPSGPRVKRQDHAEVSQ